MISRTPIRRRPQSSEEGYILIVAIFMLALIMISLMLAAPAIKKQIMRDREVETMHRGKQYARAVKLYYKKFGSYPPNVDVLVKTNQLRFLRKKYTDPITGKDDWKPVRYGQNKAPLSMGFFGQPIMGSAMGGMGMGGANGLNCPPTGGSSFGSSTSSSGSSSFGSPGSSFGSSGSSFSSSSPIGGSPCPTDTSGTASGSPDTSGNTPSTDPNAAPGNSTSGSNTGLTGQTFGGGGIIGFSPNSPKPSIMVYKKKNHYNEWEFVYDPLSEQMMAQGGNGGMIGQPAGSNGLSPGGTPGFGNSNGGFGNSNGGFGNTGGSGSTGGSNPGGSSPAPQSPPQQ